MTAREIVMGALRRLGVVDATEEPEAEHAEMALAAMNGMMAEKVLAGWLASWTPLTLNDASPLADGYDETMKAAVAVRVASDFGMEAAPSVRLDASRFHAQIAAANPPAARAEYGVWEWRPDRGVNW